MGTLTLFVVLDVADGIVARVGRVDDSSRRGLDSLIDRATVVIFFLVAAAHTSYFWPVASAIALVNIIALHFALASWRRSRVVLKAPAWHHGWSLALYLTGLLDFGGETGLAIAVGSIGALTMVICTIELMHTHVILGRMRGQTGK
jgi:hypothetical protein